MWQLLMPLLGNVLDKIIPDAGARDAAKLELLKAQQSGELQVLLGQLEINKEEAKSPGLFKGGWRPASGWTCVIGLAYTFLFHPLFTWLANIKGWPLPPAIDIDTLLILLGSLLGIGGLRSFDKTKGGL